MICQHLPSNSASSPLSGCSKRGALIKIECLFAGFSMRNSHFVSSQHWLTRPLHAVDHLVSPNNRLIVSSFWILPINQIKSGNQLHFPSKFANSARFHPAGDARVTSNQHCNYLLKKRTSLAGLNGNVCGNSNSNTEGNSNRSSDGNFNIAIQLKPNRLKCVRRNQNRAQIDSVFAKKSSLEPFLARNSLGDQQKKRTTSNRTT